MTDEIKKTSHYDVEDLPPVDVDTTLALYEQSKAVVAGNAERAERLIGEAAPLLEDIYNAASAAKNSELMATVNSAWEKTQELAKMVGQQGAALTGADVALDVVMKSRDMILEELNLILKGIEEVDPSLHPKLEAFEQAVIEYEHEWMANCGYDSEQDFDYVHEQLSDDLYAQISVYVSSKSDKVREATVQNFHNLLYGGETLSEQQQQLITQLLETCRPRLADMSGIPEELDDDDFEDEDDE
jgi:hypothetical protein